MIPDIPNQAVMVWYRGEPYTFSLLNYHVYDELYSLIYTIPDLPLSFSLVQIDDNDIPIRKIASNHALKLIIDENEPLGKLPQFTIMNSDVECYDLKYGQIFDDETTKKIQGKQLLGLFGDLATIKANASKQVNNQVINFFIGLTGGGKSTLVNHCQGIQLLCQKIHGSFHIFPVIPEFLQGIKIAEIGNDHQSCTSLPGYYRTLTGEIICDLAGFVDTKGLKQQIRNSYSNSLIFKAGTLIRIILIVDQPTLDAGRGESFVQTLKRINNLFPQIMNSQIQYCSSIIVTKVGNQQNKQDILQNIQGICDQNKNLSQNEKQFLRSILVNQGVTIFRLPRKVDKDTFQIQFEDNILQAIDRIPITCLDQDSKISLSEKARLAIINIMKNIQQMIEDEADKLMLLYPPSHDFQNIKQMLGSYCTHIDQAIQKINPFFPYDISDLVEACRIMGIKLNYPQFQQRIGSLIKNLRRCSQILPQYDFRSNLFERLLSYLEQKQKTLLLKINNSYDREQIKQINNDYMKQQQQFARRMQARKQELLESMNTRTQNHRKYVQQQISRLNQQIAQQNQNQNRAMQQMRKNR